MIIQVKRESAVNGAIPSKVFLNGAFFAYGLENDAYKIPAGKYNVSGNLSGKFGTNKIYLDVPGRSGIMFHGGNTAGDTRGCILIGANREGSTISGDKSGELYQLVNNAGNAGEGVACVVSDPINWPTILTVAGIAGILIFLAA